MKFDLPQTNYYMYELELEHGKKYVGITSCVLKRMVEHKKGKGSRWTKLHKPVRLKRVVSLGDMSYQEACIFEDLVTLRYLEAGDYGVRGGHFIDQKSKFDKDKISMSLENIPDEYKEIVLKDVEVEFDFHYKPKKQKKKKKKKNTNQCAEQEKKARAELRKASRRFGMV